MRLVIKSIAGLVFLLLVLATALFVSAGTLAYWQAYAYLGTFAASTVVVTVWLIRNDPALLARRTKAGPVAERRRIQQIIQGIAGILFLGMFVMAGLDFRLRGACLPWFAAAGCDVIVALGFAVVFLVFRANHFTSATIEVAREQTVVEHGPYAIVRHPMYAGAGLLVLFTPPALGSLFALPLALGVQVVVVVRLIDEERFLSANLPGYRDYMGKVRYRLVPFLW